MLARTPQPINPALAAALEKAIAKLGPAPCPAPMLQAGTKSYSPEPCSDPRMISSMGYTQNCRCGWPIGSHK